MSLLRHYRELLCTKFAQLSDLDQHLARIEREQLQGWDITVGLDLHSNLLLGQFHPSPLHSLPSANKLAQQTKFEDMRAALGLNDKARLPLAELGKWMQFATMSAVSLTESRAAGLQVQSVRELSARTLEEQARLFRELPELTLDQGEWSFPRWNHSFHQIHRNHCSDPLATLFLSGRRSHSCLDCGGRLPAPGQGAPARTNHSPGRRRLRPASAEVALVDAAGDERRPAADGHLPAERIARASARAFGRASGGAFGRASARASGRASSRASGQVCDLLRAPE